MRFKTSRKVQPELVASKDVARPVLTKVHLNAEKSQIEVTDSYMLARFPVELDAGDTTGPVLIDALKASRKPPKIAGVTLDTKILVNGHVDVVMDGKGDPEQDSAPYLTVPRESADYTFPDVDRLVPEAGTFSIALNADMLYRLAKSIGADAKTAVVLTFTDGDNGPSPLKPVHVQTLAHREGDPDGIIMPVRIA